MPAQAKGLTAAKVRTAKPGRYGDGGGLFLFVKPPGPKHVERGEKDAGRFWVFRYTPTGGKMREMGLGPASGRDAVSLADARVRATELRQLRHAKIDPFQHRAAEAARKQAAQSLTFRDVADLYVAGHEAGWRNEKHRDQWRSTLATYAYPHFGTVPVADVATGHVMAALEPIWQTKTETASRVRGRIEAVLDSAKARGWRSGENPARWRGHLANLLPTRAKVARVRHHPALPWQDIGAFMADLRGRDAMAARALEFCILTAARTGETLGARSREIDLGEAVWTVPAERMKAGREHRVPLSGPALAVLRHVLPLRPKDDPKGEAFVFPGTRRGQALSGMAMDMLLRRMGRDAVTVHGFRSTFRDWASESTGYAPDVAEMALAHTVKDRVEAAYRRGDLFEKRRRLMADWAAFCAQPMAEGATVTPIRAGA